MRPYASRAKYYRWEFGTTEDFELIRSLLPPSGRVLDIPCGAGRLLPLYASIANDVTMIDIEPEMLKQCQARADQLKLDQDMRFRVGDMRNFLPEESYSAILLAHGGLQMLSGLEDVRLALAHLVECGSLNTMIYIDIVDPWRSSAHSLPFFSEARRAGSGSQVFSHDGLRMSRTWRTTESESRWIVDFDFGVADERGLIVDSYSATSQWLRLEPGFIRDELRSLGVVVKHEFGNYDKSTLTQSSPRTILVGAVT